MSCERFRTRARSDPAIGKPAAKYGKDRAQQIRDSPKPGHIVHGEVSFAHEVVREPGNQKIAHIISAKKSRKCAPGRSQSQEFNDVWRSSGFRLPGVICPGHLLQPGNYPQHARKPENHEERAPAKSSHEQPAEHHPETWSQHQSRGDHGICKPAVLFREIGSDDFRIGRIGDGLANTED